MKLAIALPITDSRVYVDFFTTFTNMRKPAFTLLLPDQALIGLNHLDAVRNNLVKQAIEEKCSHILFMDTDQTYPVDTIDRITSHSKDIVSAVIHKRYPQFEAILMRGKIHEYLHVPDQEIYSGELIEIDACGTGCLLIDLNVFLSVEPPYFKFEAGENGKPVGEDIYFCNKARSQGFKIYADTSIQCGHMGILEFNEDFYKLSKAARGLEWLTEEEVNKRGLENGNK